MATFKEAMESLKKEKGITNVHAVPRINKVTVSVGVGKNRDDKSYLEAVKKDLMAITGQAPEERRARKSIAGFNVREGNLVGYRVTLRGKRMEDFVNRFINITLPRVRDFRGLPTTLLDGQGNVTVGLREHLPFPEIHPDQTDVIFGVRVTFTTTSTSDEDTEKLLRLLGFPFASSGESVEEVALETQADRAAKAKSKDKD